MQQRRVEIPTTFTGSEDGRGGLLGMGRQGKARRWGAASNVSGQNLIMAEMYIDL